MDTINRLTKNKEASFGDVKLTVTDKVKTNSLLNVKATIKTKQLEGQVEIKIHKPSDKRHKATIEVRKLTGQEYEAVESVKNLLTYMIDNFASGESVSKTVLASKSNPKPYSPPLLKQASLSIKLLSCTECDFSTKSMAALKQHVARSHKSNKSSCEVCGFRSNDDDMTAHKREFHLVHNSIKIQNKEQLKRKKSIYGCQNCGITVDSQKKIKQHKVTHHKENKTESSDNKESYSSPEPSPPRKKIVKHVEVKHVEKAEIELMDINEGEIEDNSTNVEVKPLAKADVHLDIKEVKPQDDNRKYESVNNKTTEADTEEKNKDEIIKALKKKTEDQKIIIEEQEKNIKTLIKYSDKEKEHNKNKERVKMNPKPVPEFLSSVQKQHLKDLYGYRMKADGHPGGDCLSSVTTIRVFRFGHLKKNQQVE